MSMTPKDTEKSHDNQKSKVQRPPDQRLQEKEIEESVSNRRIDSMDLFDDSNEPAHTPVIPAENERIDNTDLFDDSDEPTQDPASPNTTPEQASTAPQQATVLHQYQSVTKKTADSQKQTPQPTNSADNENEKKDRP